MKRSPIRNRRTKPRPGRLVGAELEALRQECLERDGNHCVVCRKRVRPHLPPEHDDSFHLAHRRGKRMWGDSIDQVDTNCGACHRKFHACGPSMTKPVPAKSKAGEQPEGEN